MLRRFALTASQPPSPALSFAVAFLAAGLLVLPACGRGAEAPAGDTPATESEADLVARARGIHEQVITIDTHDDIPGNFATPGVMDPGERSETRQVDLPKMREGGLDVAFFVVYVGQPRSANGGLDAEGYAAALEAAMQKFNGIHRLAEEMYPDEIGLATSAEDVERLVAEGKLVAAIGVENGYPMGEDLSLIARFKELGAGYMGITHNGHNQLGDSQTPGWYVTDDEPDRPLHGGLSELGRRAIAEMNRQGIMVDISHAGRQTMLDALEVSQAPVIASHSSARALREHGRNLDDEQLRALRENGGVIQTVAFASYVKDLAARGDAIDALREELGLGGGRGGRGGGRGGRGGEQEMTAEERAAREAAQVELDRRMVDIDARYPATTVADFVDHIDYMVELIGIDHVAISSDFDGGGGVEGWDDASETFNVTLELVRRGYTEEEIAKMWGGNTLRVWREVEQIGERLRAGGGM
jgi:membrane dipeptidase